MAVITPGPVATTVAVDVDRPVLRIVYQREETRRQIGRRVSADIHGHIDVAHSGAFGHLPDALIRALAQADHRLHTQRHKRRIVGLLRQRAAIEVIIDFTEILNPDSRGRRALFIGLFIEADRRSLRHKRYRQNR
jgi:hypothetical protein